MRRFLRRRATDLFTNAFELWVGVAAVATGIAYLIDPTLLDDAAIGQQTGPWATAAIAWSIGYAAGGLLIVYGVARPSYSLNAAGLLMLAGAVLGNAVAIYVFRGASGIGSALTYTGLACAALMRTWLVWQLHRLSVWPDRTAEDA